MFIVELKRSEWECYTDTPDNVIATINGYFTGVLDKYFDAVEAQKEIYRFMDLFQEFGFSDSEPSQTATDLINKYYKTNINRWASLDFK